MNPNNVQCKKCDCWLARRDAIETEEGYVCGECYEEDQKLLSKFIETGEENFWKPS